VKREAQFISILCCVFSLGITPAIADDDAELLKATFAATKDMAHVSFDISEAFTTSFQNQIKNGLVRKAHIQIELQDNFGSIRTIIRKCTFKKDVWDEQLQILIRDGARQRLFQNQRLIAESIKLCGNVKNIPLAHKHLLRATLGYRLRVTLKLNPVSEEERRRARRFMSNPNTQRRSSTRSFFDVLFGVKQTYPDDTFVFLTDELRRPVFEQ